MSVRVEYRGRFGNNLFQYAYARMFAEQNGLALETPWNNPGVLPMEPAKDGSHVSAPERRVGEHDRALDSPHGPASYVVDGYFQDAETFYARRGQVLSFARPRPVEPAPPGALVCHVRLEDYFSHKTAIHPSWYREVLGKEQFDELHVVAQERDAPYIRRAFGDLKFTLVTGGSLADDWDYLRRFERVVCSNSTMAWWAVFLGRAKRAVTFERWIANPDANLAKFPGAAPVPGLFHHEAP